MPLYIEDIGYRGYITFSTDSLLAYCKHQKLTESEDTVLEYLQYCCDSHLIYQVASRDLDKQQIRSADEKYYIVDHGIRGAVCGGNIRNIRDIDFTLENIVYMEMKRRGYTVTVGKFGELQIDFVCEKEGEQIYVQVAHRLDSNESRRLGLFDQEVLPLDMVKEKAPKYLVTMDEEMTVMELHYKQIKHRNIRDFLLDEEWNYPPVSPRK